MRSYLGSALFSASDLVNFTGCRHCTFLDLRDLFNGEEFKGASDPQAELLQQKGLEHERAFLSSLIDRGFGIADIATNLTLEERVILTRQAMSEGADVIYQGALLGPPWHGYSDFLSRVETPSLLGAYSYKVIDTKLSRHARPKHVLQLCVYSELLAKEQGLIPVQMHIVLGDNRQESFRTADFLHFHRLLRQRFQTFAANPPGTSEPEPCGHCEFCRWNAQCQSQWESSEHLCLTAGITRNQSTRLRAANIGTLRVLAQQNGQHLRGFLPDTFTRLTSQAALQIRKRDLGDDWVEILPLRTAVGFNRLPEPDPGDLFFDMEGDPLYEGGLEYLFGFVRMKDDGEQFVPFWAHDRVQEKVAFAAAVDFINDQLAKHPNAHIYHYNHYEMTALKRLASFHETRETDIDSYLRNHKFIDLYKVVREGVRISEPRYSLKNIEVFYMGQRDGTVKSAGDSTVSYEMWRQTHDPSLLEEIASYNHLDCRSTLLLQKWLLGIRPTDSEYSPVIESPDAAKTKKQQDREAIVQLYRSNLLESRDPDDQPFRELVAQLLEFHKREAKPEWWAMFDRQGRSEEELIDDAACLGGLRPDTTIAPFPDKRSTVYTFRFPPQDCKIKSGDDCLRSDTLEPAGEVLSIDDESLCVQLKIGPSRSPLPKELSLIPTGPIGDEALRAAIYRFADSIIAGDGRFGAVESVLRRNLPSIKDRLTGEPVVAASAELLGSTVTAIEGLQNSHLLIQGPPGAGKTFISSRVIVELLMKGHKVGVSSNSHKAINKLLSDVEQLAAEREFTFDCVFRAMPISVPR